MLPARLAEDAGGITAPQRRNHVLLAACFTVTEAADCFILLHDMMDQLGALADARPRVSQHTLAVLYIRALGVLPAVLHRAA